MNFKWCRKEVGKIFYYESRIEKGFKKWCYTYKELNETC